MVMMVMNFDENMKQVIKHFVIKSNGNVELFEEIWDKEVKNYIDLCNKHKRFDQPILDANDFKPLNEDKE